MKSKKVLVYCTHGTYGRDDDAYGALLQANHAVARGMDVALVLVEDGVAIGKKGQNPSKIGLPNNLDEISDFIELGGRILMVKESLEDRGILPSELVEGVNIIPYSDLLKIIEENDISLTF